MVMDRKHKEQGLKIKGLRFFYNSICFLVAGGLMVNYVLKYAENKDVSSISFNYFDKTTGHGYPTYSICFMDIDQRREVSDPEILNHQYHPSNTVIDFQSRDVTGKELNLWTTNEYFKYAGPSRRQRNQNLSSLIGKTEFPFFVSYQDYRKICFTKKSTLSPSSRMRYDELILNMNKFECDNNEGIPKEFEGCTKERGGGKNDESSKIRPGSRSAKSPETEAISSHTQEGETNSSVRKPSEIKLDGSPKVDRNGPDMTNRRDDGQKGNETQYHQQFSSRGHKTNGGRNENENTILNIESNKKRESDDGIHGKNILNIIPSTKTQRSEKGKNINNASLNMNFSTNSLYQRRGNLKDKHDDNRFRRNAPSFDRMTHSSAHCSWGIDRFGDEWVNGVFVARVYLHDPGFLLQNINQDQAEYNIKNIKHDANNRLISTRIQQVTRLRKRHDAEEECNPSIENDDLNYMSFLTNHLNCTPSYWKPILKEVKHLKECSVKQLETMHKFVMDRENVPFYYKPSCVSTTISAITESINVKLFCTGTEDFWIFRIFYPPKIYTQIVNTREVQPENLGSGIGGFIGMFLGISLMQLPDLFFAKYFK